jgi:tetraacyldisaccharide 4'-kinase
LSFIYLNIFRWRKAMAKKHITSIPVICIGNITVGGAGKTPVALAFGKMLKAMGYNIAFVGHGYKSNQLNYMSCIVVDKDIHNAHDVGDEALLLNMIAPTYLARDRSLAVKAARFDGAEIVVMDDGLQNFTVEKSLSVVVIDSQYLLGNDLLLPAGPLREPALPALKKADLIFISGYDRKIIDDAINTLLSKFDTVEVDEIKEKILKSIVKPVNIKELKPHTFFVMTGISNPNKFIDLLKKNKIKIKETYIFPDHHLFSEKELEEIYSKALLYDCKVLTTKKDFVKIPVKYSNDTFVLEIDVEMEAQDMVKSQMKLLFKKNYQIFN